MNVETEFTVQAIEGSPEKALVRFAIDCQNPDCEYCNDFNVFAELRQIDLKLKEKRIKNTMDSMNRRYFHEHPNPLWD